MTQEEIAALQQKNSQQEQTIASQQQQLTAKEKALTEAQKQLSAKDEQLAAKDRQLEQAATMITELKAKAAEEAPAKTPTIKVGKDTYELLSGFNWKGEEVTLERLQNDPKLAAELIKEEVGDLRKVEK